MEKERCILKFNSGNLAILCSKCYKILKVGYEFNEEEKKYSLSKIKYLPPQYCETCKPENNDTDK